MNTECVSCKRVKRENILNYYTYKQFITYVAASLFSCITGKSRDPTKNGGAVVYAALHRASVHILLLEYLVIGRFMRHAICVYM